LIFTDDNIYYQATDIISLWHNNGIALSKVTSEMGDAMRSPFLVYRGFGKAMPLLCHSDIMPVA
jgi:hypothetical protein